MHHLLHAGRERRCSARSPCARTVDFEPPRPCVRHAPRRRFDGSRRSPGWMPLPPARPHKPAGVASCVASPICLRTHGGTRVSNRSMQEAAVELGDGQWRDRPSCWAHTRHSPCTCPCSPTHARTRRRRKSAKGFATAGCKGASNAARTRQRRRVCYCRASRGVDGHASCAADHDEKLQTRRPTSRARAQPTFAKSVRYHGTKRRLRLHLRRSHSFPTTSLYL